MDSELRDAVNRQINREFSAAYLYLAMAAHFGAESLDGFAHWMRLQAAEEQDHAMRLVDHLARRGEEIDLQEIPAPASGFGSPLSVFEKALEHEKKVTAWIHEIHELALAKGDPATRILMDWFVEEQVEEEDSVGTVVEQVRMAEGDAAALLLLDRELAARSPDEE